MSDDELGMTLVQLRAAREGDRAALNDLLARYLPWVRQIVALTLGRPLAQCGDLDDIVQESLLEAFQTLERSDQRTEGSFRYWLARLAENNVRDHIRRTKAKKRGGGHAPLFADCGRSTLAESMLPGLQPTPSEVAIGRELEAKLEATLLRLDDRYREVIVLRKMCGMSFKEIADAMGFTKEVTARSIFFRAWGKFNELVRTAG
ncbi:MAG: sigma-70 family RNA polymerase sigma factor [Planctomycetes bacterium]|nr:sigma-70 family RNA polymerase sigma factor [Planctomycetota bacterium]MBI3848160.1 sigma-70 family RNA polymerase sigma factor [Planctomycetota bacterium]